MFNVHTRRIWKVAPSSVALNSCSAPDAVSVNFWTDIAYASYLYIINGIKLSLIDLTPSEWVKSLKSCYHWVENGNAPSSLCLASSDVYHRSAFDPLHVKIFVNELPHANMSPKSTICWWSAGVVQVEVLNKFHSHCNRAMRSNLSSQ